jgi:predicted alpha/beta hydrolase
MQVDSQPQNKHRAETRSSDVFAPLGSEPPRSLQVSTSNGSRVEALVYAPEGAVHGNVLIHSATACPQRFYAGFARHLAHAGLRVFTYDYRGIGKSRPRSLRGLDVTMSEWALVDARAMHEYVAAHHPDVPLAIVGHSFGAQLIGLLDHTRAARAAVFVGGQLGYCGDWPEPQASGLRALWKYVVPGFCGVLGYLPKQTGMGEDLPRGVALQWARWCSHPDYLMSEYPEARGRFARFDRPILAYSFSDDIYAPARAVDALLTVLSSASVTRRPLSPADVGVASIGHFGFFRPHIAAKLWNEATDYLLTAVRDTPQLSVSA